VLDNVAVEPDVTVLGEMLVACGARIEGLGSRRLTIHGVRSLRPIDAEIIPDRIEAATFAAAAAMTGGASGSNGRAGSFRGAAAQAGGSGLPSSGLPTP
jgi:UDP-N-acetylglucosamine 1-carboxyvinyltransferase